MPEAEPDTGVSARPLSIGTSTDNARYVRLTQVVGRVPGYPGDRSIMVRIITGDRERPAPHRGPSRTRDTPVPDPALGSSWILHQ